jgi:endonuclease/exonuclease/phosphatase family metal-dependent hydrolase
VPTLRIATFNVLFAHREAGPGSWSERRPLVAQAIERARPDVLGMQEAFPSTIEDLREVVGPLALIPGPTSGRPRWFDLSRAGEHVLRTVRTRGLPPFERNVRSERMLSGEHLPIVYRPERLAPEGSGAFWISRHPHQPGSMPSLAATPFLVHWVRFRRADDATTLVIMNAHFGHAPWHYGITARVVAAETGRITGAEDVFLIGDFNTWPTSPLMRRLTSPRTGPGFVDAVRHAQEHVGPRVTYHWGTGATRLGIRLDHVLARSRGVPARAEVVDVHEDGLYPSDHHALVVEFVLPS